MRNRESDSPASTVLPSPVIVLARAEDLDTVISWLADRPRDAERISLLTPPPRLMGGLVAKEAFLSKPPPYGIKPVYDADDGAGLVLEALRLGFERFMYRGPSPNGLSRLIKRIDANARLWTSLESQPFTVREFIRSGDL